MFAETIIRIYQSAVKSLYTKPMLSRSNPQTYCTVCQSKSEVHPMWIPTAQTPSGYHPPYADTSYHPPEAVAGTPRPMQIPMRTPSHPPDAEMLWSRLCPMRR